MTVDEGPLFSFTFASDCCGQLIFVRKCVWFLSVAVVLVRFWWLAW